MVKEDNKIKVFASDDNLKNLGELLSNETSRKIIKHLMENQMYTNEIATKLDIKVSNVIHHLKKLEDLGLLEIENKKIKRKGENHRFFKMSSDIFITINKTKEEVDKKGILKKIFKEGIKFTVIGFSAITSWLSAIPNNVEEIEPFGEWGNATETSDNLFLIPIIIIGCSLFLIWFSKKYK